MPSQGLLSRRFSLQPDICRRQLVGERLDALGLVYRLANKLAPTEGLRAAGLINLTDVRAYVVNNQLQGLCNFSQIRRRHAVAYLVFSMALELLGIGRVDFDQ